MRKTKHASARCRQRGISEEVVDLIVRYGRPRSRRGNADVFILDAKDRNEMVAQMKRAMKTLERSHEIAVVASEDGDIITTYHFRTNARASLGH